MKIEEVELLASVLNELNTRMSAHVEWTNRQFQVAQEHRQRMIESYEKLLNQWQESEKRERTRALLVAASIVLKDFNGDIRKAVLHAEGMLSEIENGITWTE